MGWREFKSDRGIQKLQNIQKHEEQDAFVAIVAFVGGDKFLIPDGITFEEVEAELGSDPLWPKIKSDSELLNSYALTLLESRIRSRGELPEGYTAVVECTECGPVYLYSGLPEKVLGCPWCMNRARGMSIPRPPEKISIQEVSV